MIALLINGQRLDTTQRDVIEMFETLAAGRSSEDALIAWARERVLDDPRLAEPPER